MVERIETALQIVEPAAYHPAAEVFSKAFENELREERTNGNDP
jgi:hypothetical protein